jgi:hypothetical protein
MGWGSRHLARGLTDAPAREKAGPVRPPRQVSPHRPGLASGRTNSSGAIAARWGRFLNLAPPDDHGTHGKKVPFFYPLTPLERGSEAPVLFPSLSSPCPSSNSYRTRDPFVGFKAPVPAPQAIPSRRVRIRPGDPLVCARRRVQGPPRQLTRTRPNSFSPLGLKRTACDRNGSAPRLRGREKGNNPRLRARRSCSAAKSPDSSRDPSNLRQSARSSGYAQPCQ